MGSWLAWRSCSRCLPTLTPAWPILQKTPAGCVPGDVEPKDFQDRKRDSSPASFCATPHHMVIAVRKVFPSRAESVLCHPAHGFYSAYHTSIFSLMEMILFHCPEFWGGLLILFFFSRGFKTELWSPSPSPSPPPVSFTKNSYKSHHSGLTTNLLGCLSSLKSFILRRLVSYIL